MASWQAFWVPQDEVRSEVRRKVLAGWDDLPAREDEAGVRAGEPIFLAPDYAVDLVLGLYGQSTRFRRYTTETRRNYNTDIALLLTCLWDGMALLRQHFAAYRPLVTATALGGAAAVFDTVTDALNARQMSGELPRLRDSALITIGRTHAQITTALFGTVIAVQLAASDDPHAEVWAAATKAHGVDVAHQAATELTLLLGAAGFRADSQVAKTSRDLSGLLLADGIHDSPYQTAVRRHTARSGTAVPQPRQGVKAASATA